MGRGGGFGCGRGERGTGGGFAKRKKVKGVKCFGFFTRTASSRKKAMESGCTMAALGAVTSRTIDQGGDEQNNLNRIVRMR